ncbi:hypothetical protein AC1031_006491 [Aphanomyces cochlioides]|nr:hypothetical protein AC1031_006491 [Aphanomyces cochlioides]
MQTINEDATPVSDVATPSSPNTMRKPLAVLATALLAVGAIVGVLVANPPQPNLAPATVASVGSGVDISVCYDSYQDSQINQHFTTIRQRFSGVRTYQTRGSRNAIDAAADAGLKIYAGVWIRTDENSINADMQAVVDGVKRNPKIVKGVYVGNEELANGINQQTVINRVKQMKQMLSAAGYGSIPVGSVQVDGDWLKAPDLAAACDIIGANIHPFFSSGANSTTNPLSDLDTRWKALYNKFGSKVVVTETGWPTSGGDYCGHKPSMSMTMSFYSQFQNWARTNGGDMPALFGFHDNPNKSPDYEVSFGLAWSNGNWKFDANTDIKGVAFVNPQNDRVLAMAADRQVEFHNRWGDNWVNDWSSLWTIRGSLVVMWEDSTKTDLCLEASAPQNDAAIGLYPCDANNVNQQWSYDSSSKQLRHAKHVGFCLDLNSATTTTPHLWTCHDVNDQYYPLQQLEMWMKP